MRSLLLQLINCCVPRRSSRWSQLWMQPDLVPLIISNSNITECNFCTFGSVSNAAVMFQSRSQHTDVIRRFLRSHEANTGIIPEIRPHNCFRTLPFHFVIYLSQLSHQSSPSQNGVTVPSILRYHPKNCHSFREWSDILTLATYHLTNGELSFPS